MKKILLLFFILIIGCSNPLDKVYEPSTYRTDFRAVQEYDSLSSIKIDFVIDYETPALGATYQEILDRFPIIKEELRIKNIILKEKLEKLKVYEEERQKQRKEEQQKLDKFTDSLLKARDSINNVYAIRRAEQRVKFISTLDKWGVSGKYKDAIIQDFDDTKGFITVGEPKIWDSKFTIDIGPTILYTYLD